MALEPALDVEPAGHGSSVAIFVQYLPAEHFTQFAVSTISLPSDNLEISVSIVIVLTPLLHPVQIQPPKV
jgi:hypothetical protein